VPADIAADSRDGAGREPRPGRRRLADPVTLGALAGVAGPVAFTLAWIVASLRQPGESFTAIQISGLAADNARDPWIMIAGFLLLGGSAIGFGLALGRALGAAQSQAQSQAERQAQRQAGPGPLLIQAAGALTIAAGLLRRDHALLTSGPESWHNHAHDVVSAVIYLLLVAAPVVLARRFRGDSRWRGLAVPLVAAAVASAGLLVVFYAAPHQPVDGLLQRIAVSLPLAALVAVALRLKSSA
jgi:hypothetical membrane protein